MQLHSAKQRRGFTLVELAVVIGIISLLAAALLPAIYGAVTRAKEARVGIELASIGKALERYKLEYGEYPPDFAEAAFLVQTGGTSSDGLSGTEKAVQVINQHLSRVYRRRLATTGVTGLNAGDMFRLESSALHQEFLTKLSPANALVFWLSGFSSNPQTPVVSSEGRSPIFEFDKGRFAVEQLMDNLAPGTEHTIVPPSEDASGTPIWTVVTGYLPPGSTAPYIYYNSESYPDSDPLEPGSVDMPTALANNAAVAWASTVTNSNFGGMQPGDTMAIPYLSTSETVVDPQGGTSPAFVGREKFQLISAGGDGFYGGPGSDASGFLDNMCSFTDGKTLEDFLDR
jgi:prepilin-type N-terminal cleavage/methylation domain-containing protein